MREIDNAAVAHYNGTRAPTATEQAQIQQIVSQARRVNPDQPVVLNINLPSEAANVANQPTERRHIDWAAIAVFGCPTLIVLVIASFVFVGCMSQPAPVPPPIINRSVPSCLFLC